MNSFHITDLYNNEVNKTGSVFNKVINAQWRKEAIFIGVRVLICLC